MAFSGKSSISISHTYTRTVGLGTATLPINPSINAATWTGTDVVGGAQLMYTADDLAVATGSDTTLDLVSALIDPLSVTAQTWTKVREIYIKNNTTTAGATIKVYGTFITTVVLGGTTPFLTLDAGGRILLTAPSAAAYAVTSSTGDQILLRANSVACTVDLILLGAGSVA